MKKPQLTEVIKTYSHFCVGSLPFLEAPQAVSFITARPWILPFWPELPIKDRAEESIARAERALDPLWDGHHTNEVSGLYAFKDYLVGTQRRYPIIKCQLAGPLTAMCHTSKSFQIDKKLSFASLEECTKACIKQIAWQIDTFAGLADSFLVVLDEPELRIWTELDELSRERLLEVLSYLYVRISEMGAYVGYHVCCSFFSELLGIPCDLLSFDLSGEAITQVFGGERIALWRDFMARGIVVVPGIFPVAPTHGAKATYQAAIEMYRRTKDFLEVSFGVGDSRLLLSAGCGHAHSPLEWLETIYSEVDGYTVSQNF